MAAALTALSAFAASAADGSALAGTTLKIPPGWSASLFVNPADPKAAELPPGLRSSPAVNARLARRLDKHSQLSLEVDNVLDRPTPGLDYFALSQGAGGAEAAASPFAAARPRGFTLRFRRTF